MRSGEQPQIDAPPASAWNPGIRSQIPRELKALCTIFRPENTRTSLDGIEELRGLTGFATSELVVFRPERLALHELLIRVTADFAVPDGSRIEDLGINFREIANRLMVGHIEPRMEAIAAAYDSARREIAAAVASALAELVPGLAPGAAAATPAPGLFGRLMRRRAPAAQPRYDRNWGPAEIARCESLARSHPDPLRRCAHRALARVLSGLLSTHGHSWGTRELITGLATDLACNSYGSDAVGAEIEPVLARAAEAEGYRLLPAQARPVVINTKGPSAAGKSTLRPLHKKLAGDIGVQWDDFAIISPDIWRKQLLDYASLGPAYKYAGSFTGEELEIIDQKLDRYMARKDHRGAMSHLLIDRFRFESTAPDSDVSGSNLLTRFGHAVYMFFLIAAPESLVERAWKRGLDVGRYKAVDDTLAHAVQAYTGMPDVFFTWVCRADKRMRFEFLDNDVRFGAPPRTAAFGDNDTINVLDVSAMLNIERFRRLNVDAAGPGELYRDPRLLDPGRNLGFLRRCLDGFRTVNFADQASGRIYLGVEGGEARWADPAALSAALDDDDTRACLSLLLPRALGGELPGAAGPRYVEGGESGVGRPPTLGAWGAPDQPRKSQ